MIRKLFFVLTFISIFLPQTTFAYSIVDKFSYPLEGSWNISFDFGDWNPRASGYHLGVDVLRKNEAPVLTSANGIIKHSKLRGGGYGFVVIIEHSLPSGEIVTSVYGHMKKDGLAPIGKEVKRGDIIGYLSSDPAFNWGVTHTHFGIRKGGFMDKVDPKTGNWYYAGYTKNKNALSDWYNPVDLLGKEFLTPPQPVVASVSAVTFNSIDLSWTKNQSQNFGSYKIYRSETSPVSNSSQLIQTISSENQLTFKDTSLLQKKIYYYKIFNCNMANQCAESNEVSTQTQRDPADLGKIVYTSVVGSYSQIFVMGGDGSNKRQVVSSSCNDKGPKWSPDGKKILFSSIMPGTGTRQVFLIDEDGANLRQVTHAKYAAEQPDWFPDGQKIAYAGFEEDPQTKIAIKGIYTQSINGGTPNLLTPPSVYPYNPSVTPDGNKIVFEANWAYGNQAGGLFMVNADGTEFIQLTWGGDYNPDISPDGEKMAFSSIRSSNNNLFQSIYVTEEHKVGASVTSQDINRASNEDPAFSPDSKKIIYAYKEGEMGDFEIRTRDLETGDAKNLTDNAVQDKEPDWYWEE